MFFMWYDWVCKKVKEILWPVKNTSARHVSSDPKLWVIMGHRHSRQMDSNEKAGLSKGNIDGQSHKK